MKYIIGIVRTKTYVSGKQLPKNKRYYEYFRYDNTGYPIFTSSLGATHFISLNQAKEAYERNKDYLYRHYGRDTYDWDSVVIREINFIDHPLKDI